MASGNKTKFQLNIKPVTVPAFMVAGEKFLKWEEETNSCTPVTLKIDPSGFYLYYTTLNNEVELIDIATIRDARAGKSARTPKDVKLRAIVNYGNCEGLEDKSMTIITGPDFVNLNYYCFTGGEGAVVLTWTSNILQIANNALQLNAPVISTLKKMHTKTILQTDKEGNIVVKNLIKQLTLNKEDKKRVERALFETLKIKPKPTLEQLSFRQFLDFYLVLTTRPEISTIIKKFAKNKKSMSPEEFMEFINKEQRDPRLNEILYPYATPERAKELIDIYEEDCEGCLTERGLLAYLMSEDNALISYEKYDLSDDMDQPLSHYFINSSHNTYLTGHQLTGKSSVEMYRQALLSGCRCVELDFWNGPKEEPVIVHGYTLVPDIPARDVIEAIAESAFKTSQYPVILSFENHCNPKQQAKIAAYCREFFGDYLVDLLPGYDLTGGSPLPPPNLLKNKIIIKNKKKHSLQLSEEVTEVEESDESIDEDDDECEDEEKSATDKGTAGRESEAGAEISALVNYVQPVHFYSFEASKARNKSHEMSSFDERQALTLLKERPVEFVNYNKFQLSRVYPRGTRVDSGNFMPQLFWNAGCQLAALNFQTMDLAMQLNLGIFELNSRCGYLLKPEFMRRKDRQFDPFAESTVDGIIAGCVEVEILSATFLSTTRSTQKVCIEAEMYGLPTDTIRKRFKTKPHPNTLNPLFEEELFTFKKVVLPSLAHLRIVATDEAGRQIGHRVLPVTGLRPGYRHVVLRNESGQPLSSSVFVKIGVKDYVPDGLSDFAEALMNPIKYSLELDKRASQLTVFLEEEEETPTTTQPYPTQPLPLNSNHTHTHIPNSSSDPQPTPSTAAPFTRNMSTKKKSSSEDSILLTTPPPPPLASLGRDGPKTSCKFWVESLHFFVGAKGFRDKQLSCGKKVEELRNKGRSGRLVKKLSKLDLNDPNTSKALEKELIDKCIDELHTLLTKSLKEHRTKQQKLLSTLKEKETNELMKWIYSYRKDEYRRLSKLTRDKNELGRMKREVNNGLVAKGVVEREKIEQNYGDIERGLEMEWSRLGEEAEEWCARRPPHFLSLECGSSSVVQLLKFTKN